MSEIIDSVVKNNRISKTTTSEIGEFGETAAVSFLRRSGYKIVVTNFRTPIGRNRKGVSVSGEIDIIALDGETLCFIEVKTRSSDDFSSPLDAVGIRKQRQITRTARVYRRIFNTGDLKFRYDVVSVLMNRKKAPKMEIYKNFWTENKFKKKIWVDEFQRI